MKVFTFVKPERSVTLITDLLMLLGLLLVMPKPLENFMGTGSKDSANNGQRRIIPLLFTKFTSTLT